MKKYVLVFSLISFIFLVPYAYANTVTLSLLNTSEAPAISGLQLDFLQTSEYDYPMDLDYNSYHGDFVVNFGDAITAPAGWNKDSLIETVNDASGNPRADYARGMSFSSKAMNPGLAPHDGIFATMSSVDTNFDIDPISLIFFDFTGSYGEIITTPFQLTRTTNGDDINIIIDFRAVPIPAAVWLLGSGLLGLWGIRRRRR